MYEWAITTGRLPTAHSQNTPIGHLEVHSTKPSPYTQNMGRLLGQTPQQIGVDISGDTEDRDPHVA